MSQQDIQLEIVKQLRKVFDPEIPVNIYDLGLIYRIDMDDDNNVEIDMTLTAPNCPMADSIVMMTETAVLRAKGVGKVKVNIVFDPPWDKDKISDEAKLELGLL
ncbi:MAG: iron-sulfur cluster assembly protein [Bacteroidota bacterium]|nr:iron-sulfur cluster assembly protein [Bacteroidota bacterium]